MADPFQFDLVSPERLLMSEKVDQVVVPSSEGQFTVLSGHAPVMATLRPGVLEISHGGKDERIFVRGGFADVNAEGLTVLAEEAIPMTELDVGQLSAKHQGRRGRRRRRQGRDAEGRSGTEAPAPQGSPGRDRPLDRIAQKSRRRVASGPSGHYLQPVTQADSQSKSLVIDVVSDVVCPWCFLGKKRLETALAALPDVDATIRWHPFQLDPTVPPGGLDRADYMAAKFGDPARMEAAHDRLTELGLREGIVYNFDRIKRAPNTIDAHRLVRWAGAVGKEAEAVDRLFHLYFTEGVDVGDHEVLANLGAELGLDRDETLRRLASDEDRDEIDVEIAAAQEIGVTGVPTFILIGRYGVVGAQPTEVFTQAIHKAMADLNQAVATA